MGKTGYFCIYCPTDLPYVHERYCPRYTESKRAKRAVEKASQKPQEKP